MKNKKKITAKQYQAMNKKGLSEDQEQTILCKWMKATYPDLLFTVDLGGIRLQPHQRRIMSTRARAGHPDIMIQEWFLDKYCGLAIEFKKTNADIFKKDGHLKKSEHTGRQLEYLIALSNRFWLAGFVCGVENAKAVIKAYLEADSKSLETINKYIYPKIKLR